MAANTQTQAEPTSDGRRINLAGVPTGFQPVKPGKYPAAFTGGEWKEGEKGEYFNAQFTLDGTGDEEVDGRKVYKVWSLSPNALPILRGDLVGLGIDEASLDAGDFDLDETLATLQGRTCTLEVYTDTKSGFNNSKIRRILPANE